MNNRLNALKAASWLFGIVFFAIGLLNLIWGNDPWFGGCIMLLSFVYFLPVDAMLRKMTGYSFSRMGLVKIVLGLFILWASLGVGELFDKIHLMMQDLQQ